MALKETLSFDGDLLYSHREEETLAISDNHAKQNELGHILRAFTNSDLIVRDIVLLPKGPSLNPSVN